MTFQQWLQNNAFLIVLIFFATYLVLKPPTITGWQSFLDSFESKGAQLLLLWISNFLVIILLVRYWAMFDAQLKTTIVGILSAVNGAFLGAIGARATSNGSNGKPDTLTASFVAPPEKK
jgi:hypothetical protein